MTTVGFLLVHQKESDDKKSIRYYYIYYIITTKNYFYKGHKTIPNLLVLRIVHRKTRPESSQIRKCAKHEAGESDHHNQRMVHDDTQEKELEICTSVEKHGFAV